MTSEAEWVNTGFLLVSVVIVDDDSDKTVTHQHSQKIKKIEGCLNVDVV